MKRLNLWAMATLVAVMAACGTEPSKSTDQGDASAEDDAAAAGRGDGSAAQGDGAMAQGDGSAAQSDGAAAQTDGALTNATDAAFDGTVGPDATSDASNPPGSDADTGSEGGFGPDGAVSVTCAAYGAACTYGASCCSGVCDANDTCASSIATCAPATAACVGNTDCCSGACISGKCGATQCLTLGAACPVTGNACCSGNCSGGTCQPISTTSSCVTANNTCTSNTQCCSGLCGTNGRCALGSSYCIQTGDICYHADDCCGGICSAPNGQSVGSTNPGVCSQPSSGSVNCTGVDGSLCPGGNCGSCCSRLCAPYGPTGVNICQPAQGCRVEGDLCRSNADCCGATGSGVLGDGSVVCSNSVHGGAVGVCMTPGPTADAGTCVPEGDVCHYTASDYACGVSSARSDCCGPQNPKWTACVLDSSGVPRCNALTGVHGDGGLGCVASGHACSTAGDCCNGTPCVPDATGALVCSPTSCQPSGQSCTSNGDCCPGLPCVALPGSLQGTCTPVRMPPGDGGATPTDGGTTPTDGGTTPTDGSTTPTDGGTTPTDGGPDDAGTGVDSGYAPDGGFSCALFGQSCTSLPCCTGTTCIGGKCGSL